MVKVKADLQGGVTLTFDSKPPIEVIDALKANGYRWNRNTHQWWKTKVVGAADFLGWLQSYGEPKKPDGACWVCGGPNGYFRRRGAATPVWCDTCASERK